MIQTIEKYDLNPLCRFVSSNMAWIKKWLVVTKSRINGQTYGVASAIYPTTQVQLYKSAVIRIHSTLIFFIGRCIRDGQSAIVRANLIDALAPFLA